MKKKLKIQIQQWQLLRLLKRNPHLLRLKWLWFSTRLKISQNQKRYTLTRDSLRNSFGITHYVIGRDAKDSNVVFVVDKITDVDKAKAFYALAATKDAMKKAGVTTLPGLTYGEFERTNDAPIQFMDGLAVTHHVKDYGVWLKAYEAEGDGTRRDNGLIERGIARNLYDSNTVSIFFEVSDMTKAKARAASPELKKIMTDAGVDSPPTFRWYKLIK